ncbi:MAG: hypothetical protein AABZ32_10470 [Bacteroidota bacterium]
MEHINESSLRRRFDRSNPTEISGRLLRHPEAGFLAMTNNTI